MTLFDDLKALERECLRRLQAGETAAHWRRALTLAQRAQRAIRLSQPFAVACQGFLTPLELRELSLALPLGLREIAAEAAPCASPLALYPLPPFTARAQHWRLNSVVYPLPQRGAHGAFHAMHIALTSPGEYFAAAPFLKPQTLRFDEEGLRTQAVALHNGIARARRMIGVVAPHLARALDFECGRDGNFRYTGTATIFAPLPQDVERLQR